MVSVSNVPIHIAVGVSTLLVSIYAAAEFIGQLGAVFFYFYIAIPMALEGITEGFGGAKMALRSKPKHLKYLFAGTQLTASMIIDFML